MNTILVLLAQLTIVHICKCQSDNFDLLLFHSSNINYFFEDGDRTDGGAARALHVLNKYRDQWERGNGPPVLYLNAGDNFSFSRSYTVNSSELIADYLNVMKPDAVCLGNHDLNVGLDGLRQFLNRLTAPVLVSNVDFVSSSGLRGRVERSRVFKLGNRTIGVIGATVSNVSIPFLPRGTAIGDEIKAIRRESAILHQHGVNIVIALIHSNCKMDSTIARAVEHVDFIVAGRRTSCTRNGQTKLVEVVKRKNGKDVPIVHEGGHLRYLGKTRLIFDEAGNLITFSCDPVLLHNKIPRAPEAMRIDKRPKRQVDNMNLGMCRTALSSDCSTKECNYANLFADAMIEFRVTKTEEHHISKYWTDCPIAIVSSGTFRRSKHHRGVLTQSDLRSTMAIDDTLTRIKIQGDDLKEAVLEASQWFGYTSGVFPQFSGLRVTLNMSFDGIKRVERIFARCARCDIPSYSELLPNAPYDIIVNSKMYDQIAALKRNLGHTFSYNFQHILEDYVVKYKTITPEMQDRLVVKGGTVRFTTGNPFLHITLSVTLTARMYYK